MSQDQPTTMSVARALVDLNLTNAKVLKKIGETTFVLPIRGEDVPAGHKSVKEFEDSVKAQYQAINDLISYYRRLKRAIILSNSGMEGTPSRTVTIGSVEMTVAEAIERKSSITMEKTLFGTIRGQYIHAAARVERSNIEVQQKVDQLLAAALGGPDAAKKAGKEQVESISLPYEKINKHRLIDPLGAEKIYKDLELAVMEFEAQVDYTLSEANATTQLTIPAK